MSVNAWQSPNTWVSSASSSITIISMMPLMASSMAISQTPPIYSASISSTMPSMFSSINISNLQPGNNLSIASVMTNVSSSLGLSVEEPVNLSISINSNTPSVTSSISMINGDIQSIKNIDVGFASNGISVEYAQ